MRRTYLKHDNSEQGRTEMGQLGKGGNEQRTILKRKDLETNNYEQENSNNNDTEKNIRKITFQKSEIWKMMILERNNQKMDISEQEQSGKG